MAHKRSRRTSSAGELARDLEAYAAGAPVRARGRGPIERLEDTARSRPRMVSLAALATVALVALGFAFAARLPDRVEQRAAALRTATLGWLGDDAGLLEDAALALERLGADAERAGLLRAMASDGPLPLDAEDPGVAALAAGVQARREGKLRDALDPLEEAVAHAPEWVLPLVLLARTAYQTREFERAERDWSAAARMIPSSVEIAIQLVKSRRRTGDLDGSEREARRAIRLAPNDWRTHAELARILSELKRPEEGLAAAEEALARCPAPTRLLRNIQAALLDRLDRRAEARMVLREVLEEEPENAQTWFNLAYSHDLDCELFEAREAYREVVERRPASVDARIALAKIAAGSERLTCELCASACAAHPDLIDPAEVIEQLERAIRADGGKSEWLIGYAGELAAQVEGELPLAEFLSEYIQGREIDVEVVRIERLLRQLRGR